MASSIPPPVAENWCNTEQNIEKVCYVWSINNFTNCFHRKSILDSSVFTDRASKTLWQLRIEKSEIFSINILLKSAPEKEAMVRNKLSVVNGKLDTYCNIGYSRDVVQRIQESKFSEYPFELNFTTLTNLSIDKITISCEILVMGDIVSTSSQSNVEVAECKLIDDFSKLLVNEKFTDVKLVADGHEFRAHKAILAVRSDVFAAMFEHEFEERKSNCVDIPDIQPEVLREIIQFIYTDKAPNINKLAKDLLVAADKYALERLSLMCEDVLSVNLSVETAAETLILADRHSAKQLRANTLAFINNHVIDVMQTPDWKKMIETHAYLMAETFQVFAAQHCPKIEPTTKEK